MRHLRAWQHKPPPRAALGKPPRGTKTAGSVRLAVNAKAVMPRGASRGRGRTRHVRQGPGAPGPPVKNGPVWRNPGHAPSRRATPLVGGREKETGKPQARPKLGPTKLGCLTIEYVFLRSPPRKRGPRSQNRRRKEWVPAFAGTNGGEDRSNIPMSALFPLSSRPSAAR